MLVNFAEQGEFPLALGAVNKQQALEIVEGLNVRKLKHRHHHWWMLYPPSNTNLWLSFIVFACPDS